MKFEEVKDEEANSDDSDKRINGELKDQEYRANQDSDDELVDIGMDSTYPSFSILNKKHQRGASVDIDIQKHNGMVLLNIKDNYFKE
jgi:hypothetical protein